MTNPSGYTVTPTAFWGWSQPASGSNLQTTTPVVTSYVNGNVTKSGLMPTDLANFVGIPLNVGGPNGTPIPSQNLIQYLRWAEDSIETDTGVLLCQTWVASPPEITTAQALAAQLPGMGSTGQRMGVNYDVADSGYDFFLFLIQKVLGRRMGLHGDSVQTTSFGWTE